MEPNNKTLLELRRKALRELRKLEESHGKEVKRKWFGRQSCFEKLYTGTGKMRNAKDQQGENERQWKIKANMNTGNKILGKHVQEFLHKNNV